MMKFNKRMIFSVLLLFLFKTNFLIGQDLHEGFSHPPDNCQALTWWHWINGNITMEGITKDLEAMKQTGIGGAIMFNVGLLTKCDDNYPFGTAGWWDRVRYAIKECDRLGLTFGIFNCDGWSMSGGPWITAEESMKQVVWTDTLISGGGDVKMILPRPLTNIIYHDIALLAFPATDNAAAIENVTVTETRGINHAMLQTDQDAITGIEIIRDDLSDIPKIIFDMGETVELRRMVLHDIKISPWFPTDAVLHYSNDGISFTPAENHLPLDLKFQGNIKSLTLSFSEVKARYIQLSFETRLPPSVPSPRKAGNIRIASCTFYRTPRVNFWEPKSGQNKKIRHDNQPDFQRNLSSMADEILPEDMIVSRGEIIDLTAMMDSTGLLRWKVPEGKWLIKRIGYTSTLSKNGPASEAGLGFECDKLSAGATEKHFNNYLKKVIELSRETVGRPIDFAQMESWEAGYQNWTRGFDKEFQKRRGYSIIPWLPVLAGGYVVGSYDESDRFLWDFRKTIAELMSENYWGTMHRLCRENGVTLFGEGSGMQHYFYDPVAYHKETDIPMGEFWTSEGMVRADCKNASSVANTYGKQLAAAESFTGGGNKLWRLTPFDLKQIGDEAFILGINQYVLHSYVHQPYDIGPGFTLGRYGNHFQRLNPWYTQATGWLDYIARSQYLLRQGKTVTDVAYFVGEGIPAYLGLRNEIEPQLPSGYDYDGVNLELLEQMTVEQGICKLPTGTSYHVIAFQGIDRMTLALIRQVKRLVAAGATIVAPKPAGSPSLMDFPAGDNEIMAIADEVWGDVDGEQAKKNNFGKGQVVWGVHMSDLLHRKGVLPDFTYSTEDPDAEINYIHKRIDDTDIYFIANHSKDKVNVKCRFRTASKQPFLWNADDGKIAAINIFEKNDNYTVLNLTFESYGSRFIVFTQGQAGKDNNRIEKNRIEKLVSRQVISEPFTLNFPCTGISKDMSINKLYDWTQSEIPQIKYFSGTADYTNTFDYEPVNNPVIELDLGEVYNIATVIINGNTVANLWKPPYKADITDFVHEGKNTLKIRVTNTAVNRLIGDEQFPPDIEYKEGSTITGREIKKMPRWLADPDKRTSGRTTFVTHQYFDKDSPLEPSGLIGPVSIFIRTVQNR